MWSSVFAPHTYQNKESAEYKRFMKSRYEGVKNYVKLQPQCVSVCEEVSPAGGPAKGGHKWQFPELETCSPMLSSMSRPISPHLQFSAPFPSSFPFYPLFSPSVLKRLIKTPKTPQVLTRDSLCPLSSLTHIHAHIRSPDAHWKHK